MLISTLRLRRQSFVSVSLRSHRPEEVSLREDAAPLSATLD